MFADNIVSYTENRRGREKSLEKWSNDLERRGMKLGRSKTTYTVTVKTQGVEIKNG